MSEIGQDIALAARFLREGELVVVPTETVYGLAALALVPDAVEKIFRAKRRPANNPLIVHVDGVGMAQSLVHEWTPEADKLANAFWPGPLTLVLAKNPIVPDVTTAGGGTVAIRCPDHELLLSLVRELAQPVAAPSANLSTRLSPTRVEDLDPELLAACAYVLDGGNCEVGIESTVLDLTTADPTILRQGVLTAQDLSGVVPNVVSSSKGSSRSPGQATVHYAPQGRVILVDSLRSDQIGISLTTGANESIRLPNDPKAYARGLYAALAELDRRGIDPIYVEAPPPDGVWAAVWDRLRRASSR